MTSKEIKAKLEDLAARAPYSNTPGRELGELIGLMLQTVEGETPAEPVQVEKAPAEPAGEAA
jgi:hypothetical protein